MAVGLRALCAWFCGVGVPKDSVLEYDNKMRQFNLDRYLYSTSHYPGDYGFI